MGIVVMGAVDVFVIILIVEDIFLVAFGVVLAEVVVGFLWIALLDVIVVVVEVLEVIFDVVSHF